MVITPDSEGHLILPANTLKVIVCRSSSGSKLTQRGRRLYDKIKHTDVFTKSVKATLVLALPFEEMPEAARQYVMLTAAEKFQEGAVGNTTLDRFAEQARSEAMSSLMSAESETGQYNILTDNWDTFQIFLGRSER